MSNYKDPKTRGEIPELDHTEKRFWKILKLRFN
jgi:hypothetical protein